MQKIVILGKPNVGKSSLFNCLLKERRAIIAPIEGTTRDINIKNAMLDEIPMTICDTAGLMEKNEGIFKDIKERILNFIGENGKQGKNSKNGENGENGENNILLYVIDGSEAIDEWDIKFFRSLKNAILVVNKIDANRHKIEEWEYSVFDAKDIFFISTAHNRGLGKLKNHIKFLLSKYNDELDFAESLESNLQSYANFSGENGNPNNENLINVGIIGRVNVGKSSLLNALIGKDRSVVSEIEGTTIDPVDERIEYNGKVLNFVDTAGIRRRSKIEGIEKYALDRTNKILESSDIALLVLDSSKPFVDLDEKISGLADKHKLGIIIILNKWDIKYAEFRHIESEFRRKFPYLSYAPIITASALNKRHIGEIKDKILQVCVNFRRRISTSLLNETIIEATSRHPLPSDKGKMVKIYYATQIESSPPTIILIMNKPNSLHFSYRRYLVNFLRKKFDFIGTPILILPRPKDGLKNAKNAKGYASDDSQKCDESYD